MSVKTCCEARWDERIGKCPRCGQAFSSASPAGSLAHYLYVVVVSRDGGSPEVTGFNGYEDAERFFAEARMNWSDTYLCAVMQGPIV